MPVLEELGLVVNYVKNRIRGADQLSLVEQHLVQPANLTPVSRQQMFDNLWNNFGWPDIVKPTVQIFTNCCVELNGRSRYNDLAVRVMHRTALHKPFVSFRAVTTSAMKVNDRVRVLCSRLNDEGLAKRRIFGLDDQQKNEKYREHL